MVTRRPASWQEAHVVAVELDSLKAGGKALAKVLWMDGGGKDNKVDKGKGGYKGKQCKGADEGGDKAGKGGRR